MKTRKKRKLSAFLFSPGLPQSLGRVLRGWWFIGASRSLTSDLWMKIRARVAWATRRTATREIDRHYYSRCLVNMSIMLRETSGTRKNVHSSCVLLSVSVVIVLTRFHFFFFFSFLFLVITDTGKIKSGFVRFKNCDDVIWGIICLKFNLL